MSEPICRHQYPPSPNPMPHTRIVLADVHRVGNRLPDLLSMHDEVLRARKRIDDLERQLRCVQLYGVGYLLKHGTEQVALNPADVTVVLPEGTPVTDLELRTRVAELEARIRNVIAVCKDTDQGYLDWGVALRRPFLTDKGRSLIKQPAASDTNTPGEGMTEPSGFGTEGATSQYYYEHLAAFKAIHRTQPPAVTVKVQVPDGRWQALKARLKRIPGLGWLPVRMRWATRFKGVFESWPEVRP